MLSERETRIIQESYARIYENADKFSENFYMNLFEIAPDLRPLFAADIKKQGRKFIEILSIIILDLRDKKLIVPMIADMGRRHVKYGTERDHYQIVGQALIQTLDETFENKWSSTEKQLWIRLYNFVADIMIEASNYDDVS